MSHSIRWMILSAAVLLAVGVGAFAFNAGVTHGIAVSGKMVTPPGGVPYPYPYWGWHRPFGFGGFFVPLLFIAFWVFVVRGLFGRRRWRCAGSLRGQGPGCGPDGDRNSRLDEWHRRAHERMGDAELADAGGGPSAR
jgi:hypothetical protein